MAVPVNATLHRQAPLKSGIILGVSPSSDPTFDVEIARATSGVYETIARLSPQGSGVPVSYTDILPVTTGIFAYKARAVKEGYEAGDYTAVLEVSPISLPEWKPNITPLTGKGIGATLFISTGVPATVGTANTNPTITKTMRIVGAQFVPNTSTAVYDKPAYALVPKIAHTSTAYRWAAQAILPTGATVDRIAAYYRRTTTASVFRIALDSVSSAMTLSTAYAKTSTATDATAILTLTSSSFSFTATTNPVTMQTAMKSTNGLVSLLYVDLRYKTVNYTETV